MDRRSFIKNSSLMLLSLNSLTAMATQWKNSPRMPVLFIGHGNPMNAIEDNAYNQSWRKLGENLPKPNAILCISAHWQTRGTKVTAMPVPKTIHDFYGFPKELHEQQYPAPGQPGLASTIAEKVDITTIEMDHEWGLDHGAWSVLLPMFPDADIPVLQLSLDLNRNPEQHFALAKELDFLRDKGVLIIGSGNLVHNLRYFFRNTQTFDWALEFDETARSLIDQRNFDALVNYQKLGRAASMSIPTNEHYLPMLYTLALADKSEDIAYFNEEVTVSVSMRSFVIS